MGKINQTTTQRLGLAIGAITVVLFASYFVLNIESFKLLLHIKPLYLIGSLACYVLLIISNGLFMKFVLLPFEKTISVRESLQVSLISSVGNFFAPAGAGLGFRAIYLKKRHDVSYGDYISILLGNYILVFLINGLGGLVAITQTGALHTREGNLISIFFFGLLVVSLLVCIASVPKRLLSLPNSLLSSAFRQLQKAHDGLWRILRKRQLLLTLNALIIFQFILSIIIAWLEMRALNLSISFSAITLFSVLGSLSIFINITPGNIGIKESVYLLTAGIIGLSGPQILSVSLIDRTILVAALMMLTALHGGRKGLRSID